MTGELTAKAAIADKDVQLTGKSADEHERFHSG